MAAPPTFNQWGTALLRSGQRICKHGAACIWSEHDPACLNCYKADMQQRQHNIAHYGRASGPEE